MPMIIKGGKRYCSSSNLAEDIIYDNTNSKVEATNVQNAIDKLNSNLISLESNFSTATNDLGTLLVAKGIEVPNGSSILDMISLLNDVTFISVFTPIEIFATDIEQLSGGWTNTNIDTGKCTSSVGNASGDTNNYIDLTNVNNISVSFYAKEEKEETPLRCILYLISEKDGVVHTVATKSIENNSGSTVFNVSDYKGNYKIRVGVQVTYAPYSSTAQIYVTGVQLHMMNKEWTEIFSSTDFHIGSNIGSDKSGFYISPIEINTSEATKIQVVVSGYASQSAVMNVSLVDSATADIETTGIVLLEQSVPGVSSDGQTTYEVNIPSSASGIKYLRIAADCYLYIYSIKYK